MSNTTKKAAELVSLAVDGLDLIAKLTANTIDDHAVVILAGVREVVATITRGAEGKISLEACELALGQLRDRLAANDRDADRRLHERFDPETTGDG